MDQIYIPKNRVGLSTGSYVVVKPLQKKKKFTRKPFFYNLKYLEPLKLKFVNEIFDVLSDYKYRNIIITGSFLDKGFNFNDIDVLLITNDEVSGVERILEKRIGVNVHITVIDNKSLIKGLNTDPLYQMMLSRCVSIRRFVYRIKNELNYKILDLHLLKSKLLIESFDHLTGREKYEMLRNMISIALFIEGKTVSKKSIDLIINKLFGKNTDKDIKNNIIDDKRRFLRRYSRFYKRLENTILNGTKQK